ncbi:MAG: hypothetical protein ACKO6L_06920, partial [Flavobacteriales bacterium]
QMFLDANGNTMTVTLDGVGALNPSYQIDWGDGSTPSNVASDSHTYLNAGSYIISYTYTDLDNPFGCFSSGAQEVIITGAACTLAFDIDQTGLLVHLIATSQNTGVPYYTINWGDGSPVEVLSNAYHLYETSGFYSVCVNMIDLDNPFNCTITQCQDIQVSEQAGGCTLNADVSISGNQATVNALGLGASVGNYTVMWGDGAYSNLNADVHTYGVIDTFQVCVFYTDSLNPTCQASYCQDLVVSEPGNSCNLTFDITTSGLTASITATSDGAITPQFNVDWGDNSGIGFTVPAEHTYAGNGTYLVCVSLTDLANVMTCQINECQEVVIDDTPLSCSVEFAIIQNESQVSVTANGTGADNPNYIIDWGDGSGTATGPSAVHDYLQPGTHIICVTYQDINALQSCNAVACDTVEISTSVLEETAGRITLRVFPNPMEDVTQLHVSIGRPQWIQIDLLDPTGRMIDVIYSGASGLEHVVQWSADGLPHGAYLIRLRGEGVEKIERVIR